MTTYRRPCRSRKSQRIRITRGVPCWLRRAGKSWVCCVRGCSPRDSSLRFPQITGFCTWCRCNYWSAWCRRYSRSCWRGCTPWCWECSAESKSRGSTQHCRVFHSSKSTPCFCWVSSNFWVANRYHAKWSSRFNLKKHFPCCFHRSLIIIPRDNPKTPRCWSPATRNYWRSAPSFPLQFAEILGESWSRCLEGSNNRWRLLRWSNAWGPHSRN